MEDIRSSSDEMIDDGDLSEDEDDEVNQDERLYVLFLTTVQASESREKIAKRKGSSPWSRRAKISKMSRKERARLKSYRKRRHGPLPGNLARRVPTPPEGRERSTDTDTGATSGITPSHLNSAPQGAELLQGESHPRFLEPAHRLSQFTSNGIKHDEQRFARSIPPDNLRI
ncbi:MAG: hypothetical protein L6R35_005523 [Caloplaca aegaea]|nr:MAG: hypothetical protein L6R35_005523 [Caloplaca aegaea]